MSQLDEIKSEYEAVANGGNPFAANQARNMLALIEALSLATGQIDTSAFVTKDALAAAIASIPAPPSASDIGAIVDNAIKNGVDAVNQRIALVENALSIHVTAPDHANAPINTDNDPTASVVQQN